MELCSNRFPVGPGTATMPLLPLPLAWWPVIRLPVLLRPTLIPLKVFSLLLAGTSSIAPRWGSEERFAGPPAARNGSFPGLSKPTAGLEPATLHYEALTVRHSDLAPGRPYRARIPQSGSVLFGIYSPRVERKQAPQAMHDGASTQPGRCPRRARRARKRYGLRHSAPRAYGVPPRRRHVAGSLAPPGAQRPRAAVAGAGRDSERAWRAFSGCFVEAP